MNPNAIQRLFYGPLSLLLTVSASAAVTLQPSLNTIGVGGTGTFTVTVPQGAPVAYVRLTYSGISGYDELTSPPYVFQKVFTTPAEDLLVTATVHYSNGDPDEQDTATVDIVGLAITASNLPTRGWPTAFMARSVPSGHPIGNATWSYNVGGQIAYYNTTANGGDSTIWGGLMVIDGTISCTTTINGQTVSDSKGVTVKQRTWTTPVVCAEDNESSYGSPPGFGPYGEHRDRVSDSHSIIFTPRTSGGSFLPGVTLGEISTGPCTGWWYVSSCTLKADMETVINRYIKPDGPALGGMTFGEANLGCFDELELFVEAVMNHEYRGSPPAAQSEYGHHGRTEYAILNNWDVRKLLEPLTATSMSTLASQVQSLVSNCEYQTLQYAHDEQWSNEGPNWGNGPTALGAGGHNIWNGSYWTDWCENGPYDF